MKRGQVTVFIIIGILIVVGVGAVIYFQGNLSGDPPVPPEAADFKVYMDGCLKNTLEEGLYVTGLQGGYYNEPPKGADYLGASVAYYFYKYENVIPSLEIIEEQIGFYIKDKFVVCSALYPDTSYEVVSGSIEEVDIQIKDEKVIANVEQQITLKKGGSTTQISQFKEEIDVRLGKIHEDAEKIVNLQEADPYHICLTCIDEIRDKDIFVEGFALEDHEIVFMLTDYKSTLLEEPYEFFFAIKYKEYDCDSLPADIDDYIRRDCERERLESMN